MSTFNLSASVKSMLSDIATEVGAVHVTTERGWQPLVERFTEALRESGVTERKSEGGKAIDAYMMPLVVASLVKTKHYDVAVHRVGSGDDYLPVDKAHPANYTITGAYAVSADLSDLPSAKDSPRGMKAWLRGVIEKGPRPDGKKGVRDLINNAKDQIFSRTLWKDAVQALQDEAAGEGAKKSGKNLEDKLLDLPKHLKGARDRWEKSGKDCVTAAEMRQILEETTDKILKRKSRKAK